MDRKEFMEKMSKESEEIDIDTLMNNISKVSKSNLILISLKQLSELQIYLYGIIQWINKGLVYRHGNNLEQLGSFFVCMMNLTHILGFDTLSLKMDEPESRVCYMLQNLEIYCNSNISYEPPAIMERHIDNKTLHTNLIGKIGLLQNELVGFVLYNVKGYIAECMEECIHNVLLIVMRSMYPKEYIRKAINVKIHEFENEYIKEKESNE